nr:MAG TPA: hypothetical protein [Caudoviricetes sp.]
MFSFFIIISTFLLLVFMISKTADIFLSCLSLLLV